MSNTFVIIDQAAGQKQIEILDVFKSKFSSQAIIAGNINERQKKLDSNVTWEKTIKYNRKNSITRLYTWIVFTIQTLFIVNLKYRKAHLFIITNPPTSVFLTLILPNKFSILVFDLYPDSFYEYGMMSKNSIIYKIWAKLNKRIFMNAERIYTLGESMANRLSNYVEQSKIEVVELWTDSSFLVNTDTQNNWFKEKFSLNDKFVVMYSGNMGITHPVELIVELAQALSDIDDIYFVLIGGGHKYSILEKKITDYELQNIILMPFLKPAELPFSFNSASMGIVTLDSKAGELSVPSKVFDLFAVGVPVLGIGSDTSELSRLLKKYNCGSCFKEDNVNEMVNFVKSIYTNPKYYIELSENSKTGAINHRPENARKFL